METTLKIFAVISPFLSAYIVYLFMLKGKRKDIDIQKETELNVVLSNLLLVWNYLSRIEIVINILNNEDSKSVIPKKHFPFIVLETGYLNEKCFSQLDNSIDVLKKYDPIIFFRLEGIGNVYDKIRKDYVLPFLKNPETQKELITVGAGTILNDTLDDIEEFLEIVSSKLSPETLSEVRNFIQTHRDTHEQETIDEINMRFYNLILQILPDNNNKKPTFDEFVKEASESEEFKSLIDIQLSIVANKTLPEFLDIIAIDPNITMENLQKKLSYKKID